MCGLHPAALYSTIRRLIRIKNRKKVKNNLFSVCSGGNTDSTTYTTTTVSTNTQSGSNRQDGDSTTLIGEVNQTKPVSILCCKCKCCSQLFNRFSCPYWNNCCNWWNVDCSSSSSWDHILQRTKKRCVVIPLALFFTQQAQLEVYFEKILLFNYTMKCESNIYTSISDSV